MSQSSPIRRSGKPDLSRLLTAAALCVLGCPPLQPVAAQQAGGLAGVVLDSITGEALPGVLVTAPQLERSARTDGQGLFRLAGPLPEKVLLRLQHDGFVTAVLEVEPDYASGDTVRLSLTPLSAALRELMVTVPARPALEQEPRGSRLQLLDAESSTSNRSVAEFLQSRTTGLSIGNSGITGSRTGSVLIRGRRSPLLTSNPLVLLDGVRLTGLEILDDLPLWQVHSIEVVRGPEALNYGPGADNGVIVIRTR